MQSSFSVREVWDKTEKISHGKLLDVEEKRKEKERKKLKIDDDLKGFI